MQKSEMIKILTITKSLYAHQELTAPEIDAWFLWFGREDSEAFCRAMQSASKSSEFFPTPGAVQKFLEKETLPETLTCTAAEAYANRGSPKLLIRYAAQFADRTVPRPMKQYGSIEELNRAHAVYDATWQREFKNRFEQMQDAALAKVRAGKDYKQAIFEAVGVDAGPKQLELTEGQRKALGIVRLA